MKNKFNVECQNMTGKELRPIPGFAGYTITNDGQVYSIARQRFLKGEVIESKKNYTSYKSYLLRQDKKNKQIRAHRLVARTYIGPIPLGYVVHHLNGNGLCNEVANLEIISRSDHSRLIMKTWYVGKVTPDILKDWKGGMAAEFIAVKYAVELEAVETILSGA